MEDIDLNLLVALDVLLAEGSVTEAAKRLGLSPSAMSRTLSRLREVMGDPLLVRAGRSLVPTRFAETLQDRVRAVTQDARAILRPAAGELDITTLEATFSIRVSEAFLELLAAPLVAAMTQAAPHVRIRFALKPDKEPHMLREGLIDLEIGVLGVPAPELRTRLLIRDRLVGVVREGHPLLADSAVTTDRFAACDHVAASRRGDFADAIDGALESRGLKRAIRVVVPGFPDAMRIAASTDFVAAVPISCLGKNKVNELVTEFGIRSFELPFETPEILIAAIWHPRVDADPAQRWLRNIVARVCRTAYP
ncbi:LysR family transcriptional regulator [Rhizobium sp. 60-20]|uniref:LysR family transcriptional regulator n=1 Tax=Rhizobium sp. 60-20 TaxID=1895819 RepID=UPI000928143A|nr:LysR family transcriptional regulator [Rhizobium sp. 60-20]MBN8952509.1 LysR family transcriptional regulator [Rhizobium tropici]OJY79160.1 MAG: LysR family transcriptional regulator [Rhizobium sp. 60-20]